MYVHIKGSVCFFVAVFLCMFSLLKMFWGKSEKPF